MHEPAVILSWSDYATANVHIFNLPRICDYWLWVSVINFDDLYTAVGSDIISEIAKDWRKKDA